eukprot:3131393-Alexandrium_andersonii.AAC.1
MQKILTVTHLRERSSVGTTDLQDAEGGEVVRVRRVVEVSSMHCIRSVSEERVPERWTPRRTLVDHVAHLNSLREGA